ncbi:hypothetical protein M0L20_28580 [Spirosoma sp. RP8]|uniref:Uncharacterized protein n=1 Tax=Spirosoma liriopis TaxID=2937440 RepID=A0ABT0HUK7_9BACT|nr:hypothetical protein [Spirosoma liriopis]MCK8495856.1 hypothetical protein [Spirosoma liriopis]
MIPRLMTADQLPQSPKIPDLPRLEFSYNWNKKLDCHSYTTLRLANPERYAIGRQFGIYLNGKHWHDAEVLDVKTLTLDQLNEWIARLDTGYSLDQCREIIQTMYKNRSVNWETQPLNWILLCKLD